MNAFHKSNLGDFGAALPADINGYVPTADCGAWELTYDHGDQPTHDDDGNLTEHGEWWATDRWPEIVDEAIAAAEAAEASVRTWQKQRTE